MKNRVCTKCPCCGETKFKILGQIKKWFKARKLHVECSRCNKQFEV